MIIYILGVLISFVFDLYFYSSVKNECVTISDINYPRHYLKMKPLKLFVVFVLWALVWPLVVGVTIYCEIMKVVNNKRVY